MAKQHGYDGEGPPVGVGVDYKTLFLGSCALIVMFGGGFIGLWNRGAEQAAEDNRATNQKQWERIADLEQRVIGTEYKITQLQQGVETNTRILREIERAVMAMERRR